MGGIQYFPFWANIMDNGAIKPALIMEESGDVHVNWVLLRRLADKMPISPNDMSAAFVHLALAIHDGRVFPIKESGDDAVS